MTTPAEVHIPDPMPQPSWCDPMRCDAVPGVEAEHTTPPLWTHVSELAADHRVQLAVTRFDHMTGGHLRRGPLEIELAVDLANSEPVTTPDGWSRLGWVGLSPRDAHLLARQLRAIASVVEAAEHDHGEGGP